MSGLSGFFQSSLCCKIPTMTYSYRIGFLNQQNRFSKEIRIFFKFESTFMNLLLLFQDTYYYLLRRYLESVCSSGCETRRVYLNLIGKLQDLHRLNESHIQVFLEVNPKLVGPLLIEIFDLKSANTCNNQTPPSVKP